MTDIDECPEDVDKCLECGSQCCRSVSIGVEKPEDVDDYADFKWYLHHGFTVFLDREGDWYVDIPNDCSKLDEAGKCKVYNDRPPVCREFHVKTCDDDEEEAVVKFEKPEEVDAYIAKLKAEGKVKPGKIFK